MLDLLFNPIKNHRDLDRLMLLVVFTLLATFMTVMLMETGKTLFGFNWMIKGILYFLAVEVGFLIYVVIRYGYFLVKLTKKGEG